jgi:DNA-binding response OmpR family regulator
MIMATSKHTKEDVVTALRAGADNYIAKPFSDATLTTRLKPMIDALLPAQNTERFIRSFVNRPLKNLAIEEETLLLDFGSKRIKIDIPLMIYHGALQVEEDEEVFHPITAES